jgi:UDP-N-acetylmuramate--alanine ligase
MYKKVYFIGIGGIGMSALARYFAVNGCHVAGYDRTETVLTMRLVSEGIDVYYNDDVQIVEQLYDNKENTLVIYTPAIPASHPQLQWFKDNNYTLMKRSEVLGMLSQENPTIAVAGTHGKTSVSTMIAYLLNQADVECNAFLGGISKDYDTNLLLSKDSRFVVVEADEYDRSFLKLHPDIAIITAIDADHLDIYGTYYALIEAFVQFAGQINSGGALIIKYGLSVPVPENVKVFTYSLNDCNADFYAGDVRIEGKRYLFSLHTPDKTIEDVHLNIPGLVNVENSVAAAAACYLAKADLDVVCAAMSSYTGVKRRFDARLQNQDTIYIDDYAHHPEELRFTIDSIRKLYPNKHITGIFQPHLYSRTRDFADEFAQSLSMLDALILLDIYPAREEPIEGVTSKIIFDKVTIEDKRMCSKDEAVNILKTKQVEVLLTLGAGDIDTLVKPIEELFA